MEKTKALTNDCNNANLKSLNAIFLQQAFLKKGPKELSHNYFWF